MLIRAPWEPVVSDVTELRRFTPRERHVAFWAALWTAAVVAELLVLRPALLDRDEPVQGLEVVFACVGGSFAACGLVAWHRRPDSRSGALMTATGFAFFLPTLLGELGTPLGDTLAVLLVDLWSVLFVALLVTLLTSGRLETTVDKLLVFSFVLPLLILGSCGCSSRPTSRTTCCSHSPTPASRTHSTRRSARSSSALAWQPWPCSGGAGTWRRGRGGVRCCRHSRARSC